MNEIEFITKHLSVEVGVELNPQKAKLAINSESIDPVIFNWCGVKGLEMCHEIWDHSGSFKLCNSISRPTIIIVLLNCLSLFLHQLRQTIVLHTVVLNRTAKPSAISQKSEVTSQDHRSQCARRRIILKICRKKPH